MNLTNQIKKMNQKQSIGNDFGKVPPQDCELESIIIGTLILESSAMDRIENILRPEHFYNDSNVKIYTAFQEMHAKQIKIDMFTLSNELKKVGVSDEVGGPFALSQLVSKVSSSAHLEHHAIIIFEHYLRREVIRINNEGANKGFDMTMDVEDIITDINKDIEKLNDIAAGNTEDNTLKTVVHGCMNSLTDRMNSDTKTISDGISTGLSTLDERIIGLKGGKLIILAGRPGMGKTALMIAFAKAAAKEGKNPLIFSLEMGKEELGDRIIIGESDVNSQDYERGELEERELISVEKSLNSIEQMPIIIDDKPSISVRQIRSRARRLHKKGKCHAIFIDYLQLINMQSRNNDNREQQVAQTTRELKVLAKELNVPIILLAQLSRKVEERPNKRPQMSDLRESGAIEQDADIILFAYRPEEYGFNDTKGQPIKGEGLIIIGKNRSGRKSDVKFYHNESLTKILNNKQELPF